jgi:hypothetical protein
VSGDHDLDPALLGLRVAAPANPATPRRAPTGPRWSGANPDPTPRTDAPPTANPTHSRKEVNPMRRPSLEELQRQVEEDGSCEATDGCFVEPDGTCEHGQPSWLLALGLI